MSSPQPASSCGLRDDARTQKSIVSRLRILEAGEQVRQTFFVLFDARQLRLSCCRYCLLRTNLLKQVWVPPLADIRMALHPVH